MFGSRLYFAVCCHSDDKKRDAFDSLAREETRVECYFSEDIIEKDNQGYDMHFNIDFSHAAVYLATLEDFMVG